MGVSPTLPVHYDDVLNKERLQDKIVRNLGNFPELGLPSVMSGYLLYFIEKVDNI